MCKTRFPKRLCMLRCGGEQWVMSEYTGEIAKPFELRKIFGMVFDMLRY